LTAITSGVALGKQRQGDDRPDRAADRDGAGEHADAQRAGAAVKPAIDRRRAGPHERGE